jgi:hypothetical protein
MQQRRVRLGDVLDDYCPRERRVTNHAVVAMIEDEVKQTRCTTCDTEHEYKRAKLPSPRRKKPVAAAAAGTVEAAESPILVATEEPIDDLVDDSPVLPAETMDAAPEPDTGISTLRAETVEVQPDAEAVGVEDADAAPADDEWPVHRPLIRATLPRPEGQSPERKPTDFTIRQNGGRFDGERNGNKSRGGRQARPAQGHSPSGQSRFGNSRPGSAHGSRQGGQPPAANQPRHGNRQGQSGQRSGRPGPGGHQRPGQGRGPKRGR